MLTRILILALAWLALTGDATLANVVFAVAAGAVVSRFVPWTPGRRFRARRIVALVRLAAYFAWELVLANLRVAAAVIGPRSRLRPAIVAIPLDADRDVEIATLANLITLTPGTLSVDVSRDRRTLFVHTLTFDGNATAFRREIKEGFERRVLEALR
jgi:multicomponent Na+:H+ antiporter subunit E